MPIIELEILGSLHKVVCGEGEERKLKSVADKLNERLRNLAHSSPMVSDTKLLVVNALQMEDEIQELKNAGYQLNFSHKEKVTNIDQEEIVSKTLEAVTEYVENLANKLEKL